MRTDLTRTTSRLAIAAASAGLLFGTSTLTPAQAADLGGDCCADLEERVAELEATAVRHGNRKVKLTLSGQVNTALLYFDAGFDNDIYVIDNDESSTRIRLDAVGTIRPGLTAGLIIEFDIEVASGSDILGPDRDEGVLRPDDDGEDIQLRRANWFVQGEFGKISIGQGSMASDGAFEVSFANTWVGSVGYGLSVTNVGNFILPNIGVSLFNIGTDYDASRRNRVRYDSPTFGGFTMSASWGEDDEYDVALRFAREFNGLKVAAAASYRVDEDDENLFSAGDDIDDSTSWGGSIAFMHTPSGFHLQGGYNNYSVDTNLPAGTFEFRNTEHYWIAAGLQFRASSLGVSDITVEYIQNDHEDFQFTFAPGGPGTGPIVDDEAMYESVGIGFAQQIDAIGGTLYASYVHHMAEATLTNGAGATVVLEDDFDQITFGMRLRY